jgi:DNA-directed RNA polymerase specialized sigma24 family protein
MTEPASRPPGSPFELPDSCNRSGGGGIGVSMKLMEETGASVNQAFAEFYRQEQPGAMRLAWLLTHDAGQCDDIVQDAFTAVYRRFDTIDKPAAYLRTTVVNGVRQRARSSKREEGRIRTVHAGAPDSIDGPTGGLADAIARLPLPQRTAVVLRYWAGLPDDEIAAMLDVRPATVRSLLHRGTTHLRKEIER